MKLLRTILLGILVVAGLAYLNVIIPAPQQTSAHTDSYNFTDSCGAHVLSAQMSSETCSGYYQAGNSYSSNITITNTSGHTVNGVVLHEKSFYCENATELDPGNPGAGINPGSCLKREKDYQTASVNLAAGQSYTFHDVPTRSPSEYGQSMCGLYQNDFWFSYNNGACTSTWNGKNFGFAGDSYCKMWDGHTLKSSNPWSPEWECGNTHKTCSNNACVTVDGKGTSTCNSNADCQPKTHKACQDNACKVVAGPGADTCSTDSQCQPQTHLSCVNNTCTKVQGPGNNTCSPEGSSCGQIQHQACQDHACRLVPGPGENSCSKDTDCQVPHLVVKKHVINDDGGTKNAQDFIIYVKNANNDQIISETAGNENGTSIVLPSGVLYTVYEGSHDGYDQSSSGDCNGMVANGDTKTCTIINNDIKNATHKACQDSACVVINGAGSDSCSTDNDCKTPTHKACVSNACTLVMGSGSDSCSQDSDCNTGCTGDNCGTTINITNTNTQSQQQQQQQAVLGASVAPATSANSLPSTGAGAEVLFGLLGLLPVGLKLRKFV